MSDTPETDAVWKSNDTIKQVMTSRRLERERDEAREQNAKLRDMIETAIGNAEELTMYGRDLCRELRQLKESTK